jgi:hypothetical protein
MIWLTWHQHRKQAAFTVIALLVLAAAMLPSGLAMHRAFTKNGIADCLSAAGKAPLIASDGGTCELTLSRFTSHYGALSTVGILLMLLPLIIGLFWGAPIVAREIEMGTHRLVWTQGISRRHWALVKFGLIGGFALALAIVYALGASWWLEPLSRAGGSGWFGVGAFDVRGLAPIAYTLFALALGIFAGTVWHRTLTAMAVTLVGFLGLRIALTALARPHYLPARVLEYSVQSGLHFNDRRGDWIQSFGVVNAAGKLLLPDSRVSCAPETPISGGPGCGPPGVDLGSGPLFNWEKYQPATRFWLFQGIEAGIFVTLAVILLYVAVRRIRRIA